MRLRFFILSFLFLSYGTIMCHELVYGHHTDAAVTCHNNDSDCCHHHDHGNGHIPCTFDFNPHYASSHSNLLSWDFEDISCYSTDHFFEAGCLAVSPSIQGDKPPELEPLHKYSLLTGLGHGLRGPPCA